MDKSFPVTLFYSINNILKKKTFNILSGTTIKNFISSNRISELVNYSFDIGVFGKIQKLNYIIKPKDRLELYADITADPKIRRKDLAKS
tara:strand:+ start:243 stop:509 length:267 start_codon:yes stop_codon:yes gene_type:complete